MANIDRAPQRRRDGPAMESLEDLTHWTRANRPVTAEQRGFAKTPEHRWSRCRHDTEAPDHEYPS